MLTWITAHAGRISVIAIAVVALDLLLVEAARINGWRLFHVARLVDATTLPASQRASLALLLPCIVAWWPLLRFVGLPLAERRKIRPVSWTLWLCSLLVLAVSTIKLPALGGSLAPLALPIAVGMSWRWRERATVPIIVGGLPFLFHVEDLGWLQFPGGVWPLFAILFWSRSVCDGELRGRLLRREHLGWGEVAIILLLLSHAAEFPIGKMLGHNITLAVDPTWMLVTAAAIVGASRMPRWRFAIALIAMEMIYLFTNFYQADLFPRLPFPHYEPQLGYHGLLTLLLALFLAPFVRRAPSLDLVGLAGLRPRPPGDVANENSSSAGFFAKLRELIEPFDLDSAYMFVLLALVAFVGIASGLACGISLGLSSHTAGVYVFPGVLTLPVIAVAIGMLLALTPYRGAVIGVVGLLAALWLLDLSSIGSNLDPEVSRELTKLPDGTSVSIELTVLPVTSLRTWASVITVAGFGIFGFVLPYALRLSPDSFTPLKALNERISSFFVEAALDRSGRRARSSATSNQAK